MSYMLERRKQSRDELLEMKKIEYKLSPFSSEIYEGLVINTNDSGLCLPISKPLSEGQAIAIDNDIDFSSQTAIVLWAVKVDETYY